MCDPVRSSMFGRPSGVSAAGTVDVGGRDQQRRGRWRRTGRDSSGCCSQSQALAAPLVSSGTLGVRAAAARGCSRRRRRPWLLHKPALLGLEVPHQPATLTCTLHTLTHPTPWARLDNLDKDQRRTLRKRIMPVPLTLEDDRQRHYDN